MECVSVHRMRASVMMYFRFLKSYTLQLELCVYLAEKRRYVGILVIFLGDMSRTHNRKRL